MTDKVLDQHEAKFEWLEARFIQDREIYNKDLHKQLLDLFRKAQRLVDTGAGDQARRESHLSKVRALHGIATKFFDIDLNEYGETFRYLKGELIKNPHSKYLRKELLDLVRKRHSFVEKGGVYKKERINLANEMVHFYESLPLSKGERRGRPLKLYSGFNVFDPDNLKLVGQQTKELGKMGTQAVKNIVAVIWNTRSEARGIINIDESKLRSNTYLRATPSVGNKASIWILPMVQTGAFDFGASILVSMAFPEADEGAIMWSVPFATAPLAYYYYMANQACLASEGVATIGTTTRLSLYYLADKAAPFAKAVAATTVKAAATTTRLSHYLADKVVPLVKATTTPTLLSSLGYTSLVTAPGLTLLAVDQVYAESNRRYHENKEIHHELAVMWDEAAGHQVDSSPVSPPVDFLTGKEMPLSFGWEQMFESAPANKNEKRDPLVIYKSLLSMSQGRWVY